MRGQGGVDAGIARFFKKSISVFLHHFFLNTSIFKTTIFAYNISAPREKA